MTRHLVRNRLQLAKSHRQTRMIGQLSDLLRTSQELSLTLTPDQVLIRVAEAAASIIGASHASVYLLNQETNRLAIRVFAGHPPTPDPYGISLAVGEGLAGWVAQTGEAAYVPDVTTDSRFKRLKPEDDLPRAVLSVPMRVRDEIIGVICMDGAAHSFTNTDQGLLLLLANQASAALETSRLLKETEARLQEVSALLEVTQSLSSSPSLEQTFDRIITEAVRVTPAAEKGSLMLIDPDGHLAIRAAYGYSWDTVKGLTLMPGEGYAGEVLLAGRPMIFDDVIGAPSFTEFHLRHASVPEVNAVRSAVGVPIGIDGKIVGVLCVDNSTQTSAFVLKDLQLLTGLATQAAIALERAELSQRSRDLYLSGIKTLAAAIDAKDPYTRGHSDNVGFYAKKMAEAMGLESVEVEQIELAGLLHDIGKIGIADAILKKPGPLDHAERSTMMTHPVVGAAILAGNPSLETLIPLVRHHHEWWSGGGYPDGISGQSIPLGASIISVADAFDTITSERPYRHAASLGAAIAELDRWKGRQFRPDVVEVFLRILADDAARGETYVQRLAAQAPDNHPATAAVTSEAVDTRPGQITPLHAKELSVLYRIATEIRSVLDLPILLRTVLEIIQTELGYTDCALFLAEEDGSLSLGAASGLFIEAPTRLEKGEGICGWVMEHGLPQLIPDVSVDPRYIPGSQFTKSELIVPLAVTQGSLGTLTVDSTRLNAFSEEDVQLLTAVANQVSVAIEVAKLHDEVRRAAVLDGLTKLFNHRYFYQRLDEEISRAERYGHPLQLLLCDMDDLKKLNDTFGHLAGDAALVEIANAIKESTRVSDICARYGGDEFAVILPETSLAEASGIIDRIQSAIAERSAIASRSFPVPGMSFGVASYPTDGTRSTELVAAADRVLYLAKEMR